MSAEAFVGVVWPTIKHWCDGGDLVPVEGVSDDRFAKTLDMLAGIDAWQVLDSHGVRGIASRVQFVDLEPPEKGRQRKPYESFTVRKQRMTGAETEWAKRIRAIAESDRGWLYPQLTVQAYVSAEENKKVIYACMVKTNDLFSQARDDLENISWERQSNSDDGNIFAVFWVPWLQSRNVSVRVHRLCGAMVVGPRANNHNAIWLKEYAAAIGRQGQLL